jgi:hypothetical protein
VSDCFDNRSYVKSFKSEVIFIFFGGERCIRRISLHSEQQGEQGLTVGDERCLGGVL